MGLLPHASHERPVSTYYKQELAGLPTDSAFRNGFVDMVPTWLPHFLRSTLGYRTQAVSMPVLNGHTPLNVDFDSWNWPCS